MHHPSEITRSAPHEAVRGAVILMLCLSSLLVLAQDQYPDQDWYHMNERLTRLEPGTVLSVRTVEPIDSRLSGRLYHGVVDLNVFGSAGRLVIPRGSHVDLVVRAVRDNLLILDLDSVEVGDEQYTIPTETRRIASQPENDLVGAIIGALGGELRGRTVRVPRDFVVTFQLQRPLEIEAPDPSDGDCRDDRRHRRENRDR